MILDVPPHRIPIHAWSKANGVRYRDWYVEARDSFIEDQSVPVYPVTIYAVYGSIICCGKQEIYINGTNRSRAGGYSGTVDNYWLGGMFNQWLVLTNGVDVPQACDVTNNSASFDDLPNWPSNYRAKVIRPYKNFLVAMNLSIGSNSDARRVKWSHPADPGTLPISWDHTDPARDAGEFTISEGDDPIVDGVQHYNDMFIFTTTQTWVMRFVGGNNVFSIAKVYNEAGLLAPGCYADVPGVGLVAVTDSDIIIVTSGGQSIVDGVIRKALFSSIDSTYYHRARVVVMTDEKELWLLFPESGSSLLTRAFIWDYRLNVWSSVDIPFSTCAAVQRQTISFSLETINSDTAECDEDDGITCDTSPVEVKYNRGLYLATQTSIMSRTPLVKDTAVLERKDFAFVGPDVIDEYSYKRCLAMRIDADGMPGDKIYVRVGSRVTQWSDYVWLDEELAYEIGQTEEVQFSVVGRFFAFRFRWTSPWVKFRGYTVELVELKQGV
ncbi:MAG: hypothetical protein N3E46_10170 [Gemmataceae bacterium]|nr:hypothetical protein [Gemmataceae bacterium]